MLRPAAVPVAWWDGGVIDDDLRRRRLAVIEEHFASEVDKEFDRTLATRFGGKAVELVLRGQFGKMVANHPPELVPVPLGEVVGRIKQVPLDYDLLQTARMMGVSFGD